MFREEESMECNFFSSQWLSHTLSSISSLFLCFSSQSSSVVCPDKAAMKRACKLESLTRGLSYSYWGG